MYLLSFLFTTMREPSLFELIAQGQIPSTKIREDDEFMAILDIFPNCKGQTLVIPKQRYDSDISLMPDDVYQRYMQATKHVMTILKKWLGVKRVGMIIEWMWVHHVHIKLYPMHWLSDEWKAMRPEEKVRFDQYEWYLITKIWEQQTLEKLVAIAHEIATNQ